MPEMVAVSRTFSGQVSQLADRAGLAAQTRASAMAAEATGSGMSVRPLWRQHSPSAFHLAGGMRTGSLWKKAIKFRQAPAGEEQPDRASADTIHTEQRWQIIP